MTLYEFKLLTENQQTQLVWDQGEFVADRYMNNHSVLLYQVHSFYMEIYYFGRANKGHIYRSFSSIDQLEPYLEEIDISEITLL